MGGAVMFSPALKKAVKRICLNPKMKQDDGRIMLLSLGFAVLIIMLVYVLIAVSSLHLNRNRLQAVADNLASGAAQEIVIAAAPQPGTAPPTMLQPDSARVKTFLHRELNKLPTPTKRALPDLRLAKVKVNGRVVDITLEARGELPALPGSVSRWLYPVHLQAHGSARGNLYSKP